MKKTKMAALSVFIMFIFGCWGGAKYPSAVNIGGSDYDSARALMKTGKNRYFMAGMTTSYGVGHVDVFVLEARANGKVIKYNTFGGKGDDRAFCAVNSPGGGFGAAGYTTSYGAGSMDFYLVKMNKKLELDWAKTFGYEGPDECRAMDTDGINYALGGYMTIEAVQKPVLLFISPSGRMLHEVIMPWNGTGMVHSVRYILGGSYVLAAGTIKLKSGMSNRAFAALIDAKTAEINKSVLFDSDFPFELKASAETETGYVFAGEEGNENDNSDIVLFGADSSLKILWKSRFGGKGSEFVSDLTGATDGGFLITGTTESKGSGSSDIYLIRTNKSGEMLWEKTYGTKRDEYGGRSIYDGDVIVSAGWTLSEDKGYDIFFLREKDAAEVK